MMSIIKTAFNFDITHYLIKYPHFNGLTQNASPKKVSRIKRF